MREMSDAERELSYRIHKLINERSVSELDWVIAKIDEGNSLYKVYELAKRRRDVVLGQITADEVHRLVK